MSRLNHLVLAMILALSFGYARPVHAGNGNIGAFIGGLLVGAVTGVIVGTALSQRDQQQLSPVFEDDIEDGYETPWDARYNSGYRVVNQGYYIDQYGRQHSDIRCRRVVMTDRYGQIIPDSERVYCSNPQERYPGSQDQSRWYSVQPTMMVVVGVNPAPRLYYQQPPPTYYRQAPPVVVPYNRPYGPGAYR